MGARMARSKVRSAVSLLPLPITPADALGKIIVPALATLPGQMDSPEARLMLLAIALQESGLAARQQTGGPAKGLLQFERNGVLAVMHNTHTAGIVFNWCRDNGIQYGANGIYNRLADDDELACVFARLLLWADPRALPEVGDTMGAFDYYARNWRPGKPSYTRWRDTAYPQALEAIQT